MSTIDRILAVIDDGLEDAEAPAPAKGRFPAMLTNGAAIRQAWSEARPKPTRPRE